MRARDLIIVTYIALMIHGTARSAEFRVDFRRMSFDNDALRLVGQKAEQLVKPTERGLLIRIPPKEGIEGPVGLAPRKILRGDFEIIAEFELLRYDWPREGLGVGVGLVVEFPRASSPIAVERLAIPGEGERYITVGQPSPEGGAGHASGRVPARSRTGKLRLVRTGSTVRASAADGDGAFQLLHVQEVGDGDARVIRLGAQAGSSSYGVEALLKSLVVIAGGLVEPTAPPALETSGIDPLFVSIVAFDIALLGLASWRWWSTRDGQPRGGRVCR